MVTKKTDDMGKYLSKEGVTRLTQKFKAMFAAKESQYGNGLNWNAMKLMSIRVKETYADQPLEFSLVSRAVGSARFCMKFKNINTLDPALESFTYVGADTAWAGRVHLYKMERVVKETEEGVETEKVWEVWLTPYRSYETGYVHGLLHRANFSVTLDKATATALPADPVPEEDIDPDKPPTYPLTLSHTVCKPGTWQAGNGRFASLNIMDTTGKNILGGVSVSTSESNFQGAQNSKLWLGWRGGKRAMAFDKDGHANIGPATEVDAAYRLTVEGNMHVKGSLVADTPAPVAAREINSGTNLNDCDEPGWYVCKGVPSAELTNLPASMGASSALYFQLLVTPRPYDEDNPPSAASRYVAQVLFQSSRFSFTGIWVRGVAHTAWKKVALENDT